MSSNNRSYPQKDIKLLWGLSAGYCAFPGCQQRCIEPQTDFDDAAIIGQIAHIDAHSNDGPRPNLNLPQNDRDKYENWILLCNTHHALIDNQPNTYTSDDLRSWKTEKEAWVKKRLTDSMPNVTFTELREITEKIITEPSLPSEDYGVIPPKDKMTRNQLTESTSYYITIGIGMFREVEKFITQMAITDIKYPERLKAGFLAEYFLPSAVMAVY
jgi:hypothetical protein